MVFHCTIFFMVLIIPGSIFAASLGAKKTAQNPLLQQIIPFVETQYTKLASEQIPILLQTGINGSAYPFMGIPTSDHWHSSRRDSWTSGFLAGALWQISYLGASNSSWEQWAQIAQQGLLPMQFWNRTHDVGFVMFCSFGNAYILTHNSSYLTPLHNAALSLSTLYSQTVGCTRSWPNDGNHGQRSQDRFLVIIDNMMNLELLFWVANQTADSTLYDMAFSHANRTSYDHIRPDGSTWQVVCYNSTDGSVMEKYTVQGYANDSTWARGQAWAIYGFTMAFRYTGHNRFLQTARKTADFFLEQAPSDMVPYWDFDAPYGQSYQPRDTSAAAIAASAMVELGQLLNEDGHERYRDAGVKIVENLMKYKADVDASYRIPAILVNGTAHYSRNHFDTALIFGDYYFVEALARISRSMKKE
eukprot:Gb_41472 [translate_table: standard]